ncbi:serine/threonine-protein phosphatase 6 regulatory subunit 1 isoform X2 [Alligator mississippiensis]|uniref:serine/threonine-protein phosphatase 6 regulatory subunit 1 isoform X2 n=1 Tax=Alligator mississippiensis TaxID=8496 RepID=UPI0028776178|nr:serine/threonine-protein phosphatase 6 regulatory subunit 1 isoform X2 [Alligator mississippiensis]
MRIPPPTTRILPERSGWPAHARCSGGGGLAGRQSGHWFWAQGIVGSRRSQELQRGPGRMFWKFDLHTSSHIETLLERDNVTLAELLDEDDVLQECKVVNRKLVDFLVQPQHMEALVTCVTQEPPAHLDERLRYKYPSVSCEILTSDVTQINDALGEDETLLRRLYGFLQSASTLNPLLASFFSKVMGILINRKTDQIVAFLRKKEDFVSLLLRHIGTSAIMDLLLRLLTCVEQPQLRQDVFTWLNEEKIVQRLIEMIHPSKDDNQHSNAAQSLCDIIRLSREQMIHIPDSPEPDQLLATLEKQETIEQLLSNMFTGEHSESVLVSGIQVLLTLLEPRRSRAEPGGLGGFYCNLDGQLEMGPGSLDVPQRQVSLGTLLALRQRLPDFHQLLLEPPKRESLRMTWGLLDLPLGNTRLHVVKLLASALAAGDAGLQDELLGLGALDTMLDLYFEYSYNNFLHAQVEACLSTMLQAGPGDTLEDSSQPVPDSPVITHLLQKCRLVQRVLSAWEENEQAQLAGGRRKGYMGHLTRIANALAQSAEKGPHAAHVGQLLKDLPEELQDQWEKFISGHLAETNKKNMVDLVNTHNLHSSSDDDDGDLKEFSFPQEAVLQQAFVDYQMQQMTSAFIDHFGFNDEEFGEQEESVNAPFDKTANITFSLNADDESPNSNLFEICYKEHIQQFDDDEEEEGLDGEDSWHQKALDFPGGTTHLARPRSCGSTDSEDSRDSEEEEGEEEDTGGGGGGGGGSKDDINSNSVQEKGAEGPCWTASLVPADIPAMALAGGVDTGAAVWDTPDLKASHPPPGGGWAPFTDSPSLQTSLSHPNALPGSHAQETSTQSNVPSAGGLQESPRMGSPPQALNGELESHASSPTEGQPPYRGLASMDTEGASPSTSDPTPQFPGLTDPPRTESGSPQRQQQPEAR